MHLYESIESINMSRYDSICLDMTGYDPKNLAVLTSLDSAVSDREMP